MSGNSKTRTLINLFEIQVQKTPDAIAVICGQTKLTYNEVNRLSNQLGDYLRSQYKISSDDLVGIKLVRSEWMVIAVLGILKAGAAFVPVDPEYPDERIDYIIKDSNFKVLLDEEELDLFNLKRSKYSRENPDVMADGNNIAYCIYTSGSTGIPKGVLIKNESIVNYVESGISEYITSEPGNSGSFMHMSLSFDASLTALFVTLLSGRSLVVSSSGSQLEVFDDINFLKYAPYDFIKLTPSQMTLLENLTGDKAKFATGKYVLGGETLHKRHFKFLSDAKVPAVIINEYGPTEATVGCISYKFLVTDPQPDSPNGILIGKAMPNVNIYILDKKLKEVKTGGKGEIYIGGIQLAKTYLNKPDIYKERFIPNPFSGKENDFIYKSGDLASYTANGNIEYMGREDNQVKILGNRIELGEIEFALMKLKDVELAVVIATEDIPGEKRLMAYIQSKNSALNISTLLEQLRELIPSYMLPSGFVILDKLPMNVNGKIDVKNLPKNDLKRPNLTSLYRKPSTEIESDLAKVWQAILKMDKIGVDDNFFELGGNSLLALKMVATIRNDHNYILPITKLYQYPNISEIAGLLGKDISKIDAFTSATRQDIAGQRSKDVAIIGMSARFPGAGNLNEYWEILKSGKETIRFFSKEELDRSIPDHIKNDPDYVSARGLIDDADKFDAEFFGLHPKVAEMMDPQHRIFMESVWELLEGSGYLPQKYNGVIGIYAGTSDNTYFVNNVLSNENLVEGLGMFQVRTLNEKDYIASRTAYHLNLKGPAVSLHSACSTSSLAIAHAVESIRKGQCDIAVAGASSVTSPINSGHIYQDGAILSKDGHCKPFDADASGTIFSDGVGSVLLKDLETAKRDGDHIYAVIKGIGINNDGNGKGSFTAPSAEGQAGAIKMAIKDAGINISDISYVEAHGTGTPIGDPIEIEGLRLVVGDALGKQSCSIGSVKSNFGHLMAVAGVAGVIKTVLSMNHRQIPPTAGFTKSNPNIDFENSPFRVNSKVIDWNSDKSRVAGVSSFGVGGTNVHLILEEFQNNEAVSDEISLPQLITWSAKSPVSRENFALKLSEYIRTNGKSRLADIAYTLQKFRMDFNHRRFIVAPSSDDFLNQLMLENVSGTESRSLSELPGEIVFSFPGQGAQYLNMGRELYVNEPIYREAIDTCADILFKYLNLDIREIIFQAENSSAAEEQLKNTRFTQPALFITEYALSRLWKSWGVEPTVLCGHSIGEFVAAHLAGVFTLEDALKLISTRGLMVSQLPKGSMLSVRLEAGELNEILPGELSVAAINNRKLCVVAGTDENIALFSKKLDGMEIPNRVLLTSHAFHSSMMDPIIDDFREVVGHIQLNKPNKRIISTVSGTWMKDEQATDPKYWADHLRKTVRFADALDTVAELDNPVFIEVGPGNVTSTLAKQQLGGKKINIISSIERNDSGSEYCSLLKALGQVWMNGVDPDWDAFYGNQKRIKLLLPTYAFDKKRYWVEPSDTIKKTASFGNTGIVNNTTIEASQNDTVQNSEFMRKENLFRKIKQLLEDASGIDMSGIVPTMSFLEIGLDSLLMTQIALTFRKQFGLPITFRQLNESYSTPALLIEYLDANLPKETYAESASGIKENVQVSNAGFTTQNQNNQDNSAINLIAQQLQMLANQVALIQNPAQNPVTPPVRNSNMELSAEEAAEIKKPFGATPRIEKQKTVLNSKQLAFLDNLTERYNKKNKASKAYTQKYRAQMSDPRVVSGFKPLTKEIVYPIVINRSKGSKLWDIDGNEYIDALNGFGSNMMGWQPDFIKSAMHEQIENGYEVGPQHELAGEVCSLICEFTGHERAALCTTGSEAVLGAMRIARTVTGKQLIVSFNGSYHGIVDEVLVRGTKKLKPFPAAAGIMPEAVQNMLVLDYGTDESLKIIAERAHEIAAVLVEPVQSRRPEFVPVEFLKQVRKVTKEKGVALIFDEVITGFRMHPGGVQAMFGIKADIASYGKVVGAGNPIGVIAGSSEYMDALDGGFWRYGDESFPEVGVTYFAGTFVRHPMALAAAKASLLFMKEKGPDLQNGLNEKARFLAEAVNKEFEKFGIPAFVAQFGSLWKIKFNEEIPYSELLFTLMREKGIHVLDGFPCFMTVSHTKEEINTMISCFKESIKEMIEAEFFKTKIEENKHLNPPVKGAKLGRDQNGDPKWYIEDPNQAGKYFEVN